MQNFIQKKIQLFISIPNIYTVYIELSLVSLLTGKLFFFLGIFHLTPHFKYSTPFSFSRSLSTA